MTDEQIIEAIATKVMGWHSDLLDGMEWWWFRGDDPITHQRNFDPLTNPADSKQVREKLAEQGWQCTLVHKPFDNFEKWVFHAVRLEDREGKQHINRIAAYGTTEYEAVNKFALKSVGIEVEP